MPALATLVRVLLSLLLFVGLATGGCGDATSSEQKAADASSAKAEMKSEMDGAANFAEPAPAMMDDAKAKEEAPGGGGGEDKGGKPDEATWKRSVALANTSKLMVGDDKELPLQGMHVRSQVDGFRARVLIDFFFYNPDDQQYEGTFKLRLPDGASPMFLAFGQSAWEAPEPKYDDAKTVRGQGYEPSQVLAEREASWIEPKVARMVQRVKAASAYGATVRRRVDPALMEWAGAGIFNARIFPIAGRKLHRVVVAYDMDLTPIGDDLELQIPIPEGLPSSTMDLNIATPGGVKASVDPKGEKFPEGERQFHRLENLAGQTVTIRLAGAKRIALTGNDPAIGSFFAAAVTPEGGRSAKAGASKPAVFAVDTSLSSNPDRFNVWLKLMRAILENNRDAIPRFAVMFFNVDTGWWQKAFVANDAKQVDAVIKHAETLALEGATDLAAAFGEAAHPGWLREGAESYDVFLLSDGAATWGPADRYAISKALDDARVGALYAYKTGMAGGDTGMLDHLARETGGAVFSVVGESEVATASTAHTARPWAIEKVEIEGCSDLMLAGRPSVLFPGQRLFVVGRGAPSKGAEVVLTLSQDGTTSRSSTALSAVLGSDLTPRSYGQVAVDQLEDLVEATESVATAYARHFRVTGKTASLLMLESEEEYRAFGIEPAADAGVIAKSPAADLIHTALAQLAERLGDPKAAFMHRLVQLGTTPGVMLAMPADLQTILDGLPASSFAVDSVPLQTKQREREGIDATLLEQLAKQAPEYDTVTKEAERRLVAHGGDDALAALSSLVEANPGDGVLARDVGFSAMQWGLHAQAYQLFTRVADARPYEPQTYRAMALSLAKAGQPDLALAYFEVALAGQWDARFGEFRQILLQDYVRFLGGNAKLSKPLGEYAGTRAKALREEVGATEADILITITWNTDNTDVDLHVIEPSGEECFYSHNRTASGGSLTRDVTQGYGPEMYVLPKAPEGKYIVRAKYFASDVNRASARTKVYATITRNWGKPGEKTEEKVVTLELGKDMHDLITVVVP